MTRHRVGTIGVAAFAAAVAAGSGALTAQAPPAVEKFVKVGEYNLHVRIIPGSGTTILMESGGGPPLTYWGKLPDMLARETGATVVAYERAGVGKSDLPSTPYDIREDADMMWQALGSLGLDKQVILIGHSWGGLINRLSASRHPEKVKGLVFVDPFSVEFVDAMGGPDAVDRVLPVPPVDPSQPEREQRAWRRFVATSLSDKIEPVRHAAYLQDIPVRVITAGIAWLPGDAQSVWRKAHETMTASMKGARLVVAERSDHMVPTEQPELIVSLVSEVARLSK